MLEQKIKENEKIYTDGKAALEKIIDAAKITYNSFLKEYKDKLSYIKNNSMLSSDGKMAQATKLHDDFLKKVSDKGAEYITSLQNSIDATLKSYEDYKTESKNVSEDEEMENNNIKEDNRIQQIIYVSAMMNFISQLEDVSMLKEVFEYACLENNFCKEAINLIYIKANSILNAANVIADENQSNTQGKVINELANIEKSMSKGKFRTTLNDIVAEINKYKHDYTKEFNDFKFTFGRWKAGKVYPLNLYVVSDPRNDFKLESVLNESDPWNKSNKSNDSWRK